MENINDSSGGQEKKELIFSTKSSFSYFDGEGEIISKGEAKLELFEDSLSIFPERDVAILIPLRELVNFDFKDYRVYFNLISKEKIEIFDLGYKYEDFIRIFTRVYNELVMKDMLMKESLRKSGVDAEFCVYDENGNEIQKGNCELRLYDTALIILPEKGELRRIIYSDMAEIKDNDYKIEIISEYGEKIIFSQLGNKFDSFLKSIFQIINELSLKVQESIKILIPNANTSILRKVAQTMKEGKAAKRQDIEKISPDLWLELEKKIKDSEIKEEYNFLKSIAKQEKIAVGLKRDLLGDLTGEYIWFLIPIYGINSDKYGNAVAMEAITGEEGAKATYFFRITGRQEYKRIKSESEFDFLIDDFLKKINRAMLAINFRREPIYLSDEKLKEPQYEKYQHAMAKIPALIELRKLFIGRVIHSSFEQWKKDTEDLLLFNIKSKDDDEKWTKKTN